LRRIVYIEVIVIGLMGLYFLALWVHNSIYRLPFPFPIEYLEDAIFFHALRISEGLPLYVAPDAGFVPIIYTPGYFYLLAGLFKIFGPSIILPRFVNLFCTLGIIVLLSKVTFRRLKFPLAIVPLCVFLSFLYAHFAGYQDLGRVDPFMVLMVLLGLCIIGDAESGLGRIITGVTLLTLACYIKQPAVAYLPFVYIFLFIRNRKAAPIACAASISILAAIFLLTNAATGNHFAFYTLRLPMAHPIRWENILVILRGGLLHYEFRGILYLLVTLGIFISFRLLTLRMERVNIFEATLPGAALATIIPFMKEGGYFQDLIPLYTHICFLLPFALSIPFSIKGEQRSSLSTRLHPATPVILLGLLLHCAFSVSPWDEFTPKAGNVRLGYQYVNEIKNIQGDVFMPSLGYYAWLAGKPPGYVGVALTDLLFIGIRPEPLINDVRSGKYSVICLPEYFPVQSYWPYDLADYGYVGPNKIIPGLKFQHDLNINIEMPPNNVYAWAIHVPKHSFDSPTAGYK